MLALGRKKYKNQDLLFNTSRPKGAKINERDVWPNIQGVGMILGSSVTNDVKTLANGY